METSDHQRGEYDASGQEYPKLEMIVEVASVMNALDQIGAADGHLQDLGRLGVDLDLIAVLAPHLDPALRLAGVVKNSTNVLTNDLQ